MQNINELLKNANSIAIAPSTHRGADAFCAGVGLYHMIRAGNGHKYVSFLYNGEIPVGCADLIDEKFIEELKGTKEVEIAIDYSKNPTAQLHYNHDDNVLHLKLGPVGKDFSIDNDIEVQLKGSSYDLVITIGAHSIESLGMPGDEATDFLKDSKVINIDNSSRNKNFGEIDLVQTDIETLSLLVFKYSASWELSPSTKAAQSLLRGITL